MKDHITVNCSTAPSGEDCAQVGAPNYFADAQREGRVFIHLIQRTIGIEPDGAHLRLRSNSHDFGSYITVDVDFDSDKPEAVAYAMRCEAECPEEWDDEARALLRSKQPVPIAT